MNDESAPVPSKWDSIDEMFADIRRYVAETGERVVSSYVPNDGQGAQIRYSSGSKQWTIALSIVLDKPPTGDFAGIFQTDSPRESALRILNGDPPLPVNHDKDLERLSRSQLVAEVKRLREGIRADRDSTGHNLCWYRPELWDLLPEKVEPEPTVPPREEFLHHCAIYRDSLDDGSKT